MKHEEKQKDFSILSLKEIRRKRKLTPDGINEEEIKEPKKKQKVSLNKTKPDISEVKVKTLDEIRAERAKRAADQVSVSSTNEIKTYVGSSITQSSEESEVSSTSKTEDKKEVSAEKSKEKLHVVKVQPIKRLKRKRSSDSLTNKEEKVMKLDGDDEGREQKEIDDNKKSDGDFCDKLTNPEGDVELNLSNGSITKDDCPEERKNESKRLNDSAVLNTSETSRLDEVLLLDEEEFDVDTKAEEDILKDIDELLNK